ncbi:MAG: hypothetical protein H7039_24570 [Bryobacteraceae bacterium]|nr:hypothetical protein [Bryobacteraceae bacterium]
MSRCLTFALSLALSLIAAAGSFAAELPAILPAAFSGHTKTASSAIAPVDAELWKEFGFEKSEQGSYSSPKGSLVISAWRFSDPTGAFAAWQAEGANASNRRSLVHSGNYLLRIESGRAPEQPELRQLAEGLAGRTTSPLPPLYGHLPEKGRVANSERYLLGPAALTRHEPRIPATLASFDRGAEAQLAKYSSGSTELQMTIFGYPTPQIAIERFRQFEKLDRVAARRSGTMIAVVPEGRGNVAAEKLLAQVNYRPSVMWNEYPPKHTVQDAANMILAISILATGLIVCSLILGLFFGGGRILARKFGMHTADDDFTSLHLS